MSVTPDPEWRDLMEAWQSEAPEERAPAPLSDEVRRRIRKRVRWASYRLLLKAAANVITSVGMIVWLSLILDFRQTADLAVMIASVIFIIAGMTFSFWNFRGTWWPTAESTATFVDLSLERCRRKLVALRFCYIFLAVELAFMIPWAVWALLSRADPWAPGAWFAVFGWMAFFSAAMSAWAAWYKKRTLREMAEWEELRRSLS